MKKGWDIRSVNECCMGSHFFRWYIKSPSGNFYEMYRGIEFPRLYLRQGVGDYNKSLALKAADGSFIKKFTEGVKYIYELESSKTYDSTLSSDIENLAECKALFARPDKSVNIFT